MSTEKSTIKKDLEKLCIDFINILETYREEGIITEEEYIKFIALKKDFLKNNSV